MFEERMNIVLSNRTDYLTVDIKDVWRYNIYN